MHCRGRPPRLPTYWAIPYGRPYEEIQILAGSTSGGGNSVQGCVTVGESEAGGTAVERFFLDAASACSLTEV